MLWNAKEKKMANTNESGGVIQGRSYPHRFDKILAGKETEQWVCDLTFLEYHYLDFPLPIEEGDDDDGRNLSCKMDYDNRIIRIQSGTFPDKVK